MGGKFRLAGELVRDGRIGKVKTIECRIGGNPRAGRSRPSSRRRNWTGTSGSGRPRRCRTGSRTAGKTNCHYEFRWWYEYSGGKMTDWGAHHLDIAQWVLGMDGSGPIARRGASRPTSPTSKGDGYNCHPNFKVQYTYANGAKVIAMSGRGRRGQLAKGLVDADGKPPQGQGRQADRRRRRRRERRAGRSARRARIFVSRGLLLASDEKILSEPLKEDPKLYPTRPTNHMENFLDCVKSRETPICDVEVGGRVGDRLPHRRDRAADRQEAEVGPEGVQVRRRRGEQDAQPRAPRRLED